MLLPAITLGCKLQVRGNMGRIYCTKVSLGEKTTDIAPTIFRRFVNKESVFPLCLEIQIVFRAQGCVYNVATAVVNTIYKSDSAMDLHAHTQQL